MSTVLFGASLVGKIVSVYRDLKEEEIKHLKDIVDGRDRESLSDGVTLVVFLTTYCRSAGKLNWRETITKVSLMVTLARAYSELRNQFIGKKREFSYVLSGAVYRYTLSWVTVLDTLVYCFIIIAAAVYLIDKVPTKSPVICEAKGKNKMRGRSSRGALKKGANAGRGQRRFAQIYDGDMLEIHFRDEMTKHEYKNKMADALLRKLEERGDNEEMTVGVRGADGNLREYTGTMSDFYDWIREQQRFDTYDEEIERMNERLDEEDFEPYRREAETTLAEKKLKAEENLRNVARYVALSRKGKEKPKSTVGRTTQRGLGDEEKPPKKESFQGTTKLDLPSIPLMRMRSGDQSMHVVSFKGKLLLLGHGLKGDTVHIEKDDGSEVMIERDKIDQVGEFKGEKLYATKAPNGIKSMRYSTLSDSPGESVMMVTRTKNGNAVASGQVINKTNHTCTTTDGDCGAPVLAMTDGGPRMMGVHCFGGTGGQPNEFIPISAFNLG